MAGPTVVSVADFHARMKAQGVEPNREDVAFVCPMCGTVQSMRSLIAAGVPAEKAENYIGFSCEGRWTDAGPPSHNRKPGKLDDVAAIGR